MSLNFTNKIFSIGGEGTPTLQFCKGGFIIGSQSGGGGDGSWQVPEQTNLTLDDTLNMITAFGSNKYVAIAQDGYASTSTDGIDWSAFAETALVDSGNWSSIAYGNNKFVAAGLDGNSIISVSTSTDGTTWTTPAMCDAKGNFLGMNIVALTYTGQQFVILGVVIVDMQTMTANWAISTSTDGTTWTTPTFTNLTFDSPNPIIWYGLVFGNGKYVAVGMRQNGNYISTSTDGITWTTPQIIIAGSTNDISLCSLVYDNSNFILLFSDNINFYSMTSTDGITWTEPVIETNLGDTATYTTRSFQTFNNTNFVYPMLNQNEQNWYITTYQN